MRKHRVWTAVRPRAVADGHGVLLVLRLPDLHQRPGMLSTCVTWLLADLFGCFPEVGDTDRPRLVLFFDEAHLRFADASKQFLAQVVRMVRLIGSTGIVVVTQSPVAVTRVLAPAAVMGPANDDAASAALATSPLAGHYAERVDPSGARTRPATGRR